MSRLDKLAGDRKSRLAIDSPSPAAFDVYRSMSLSTTRLNAVLGTTLVSTAAGAKDTKAAIRWAKAKAEGAGRVGTGSEKNLRMPYRAMTAIATAETPDIARAWFIAADPLLDEDSPVRAIREGRHRDVVRAFTAVVTGDWIG